MEALQLQLKQAAIIDFNQDQLEKYLIEVERKYSGIVVTEDNLSDIGKTRATIKKLGNEIHTRFSDVKKQALEPISGLELSVKDAKQRLETLYRSIKDQEDAYEVKRRDSARVELDEIRLEILADNYVNDDYQHLVEIKDSYLNKTADRTKTLDEFTAQAKQAYTLQKADQDAAKIKEQKQKMIAEFCSLYSDKYELTKPIQSIAFSHLIEVDVDEIQLKIEYAAIAQHAKETELAKQKAAESVNSDPIQLKPEVIQQATQIMKGTEYEPVKTMDIRIFANSQQRIALTDFMREAGIKFELITQKAA